MKGYHICFTSRGLTEFILCHPMLQAILLYAADSWPPENMIVGDIYRTEEEEKAAGGKSGIHRQGPPYRAIDLRVRNLENPQQAAEAIAARVNAKYIYDPTRPEKVVAYAAPHGTGPHIHLQTCPRTAFRASMGRDV